MDHTFNKTPEQVFVCFTSFLRTGEHLSSVLSHMFPQRVFYMFPHVPFAIFSYSFIAQKSWPYNRTGRLKEGFLETLYKTLWTFPKSYHGSCIIRDAFPACEAIQILIAFRLLFPKEKNSVFCNKTGKTLIFGISRQSLSTVWIHSTPKWQSISNPQIKTGTRKNTCLWTSPAWEQTMDWVCKRS